MTRRLAVLNLVLAACGSTAGSATPLSTPTTTPTTTTTLAATTTTHAPTTTTTTTTTLPPPPLTEIALAEEFFAGGCKQAVCVTARPGDDRLYVADQVGKVYALRGDVRNIVLDVNTLTRFAGEQGFLGLAFHPTDPSRMFVHYSANNGDTVIEEYSFPLDAAAADPSPVQQ